MAARQMAREFGYSEQADHYCWSEGISSSELLGKLFDLELEDEAPSFPLYEKTIERLKFEEETLQLLHKHLCVSCVEVKRTMLYLPCCHLVSCKACVRSSCQECKMAVTESICTFR